eukprot:2554432-Ditylum_brightwellii.AAC.1
MGAFAMAPHGGRFLGPHNDPLAECIIQGALSYVASSFWDNNCPNPTKDNNGKLGCLLPKLFQAFKNRDMLETQQHAIPICVI